MGRYGQTMRIYEPRLGAALRWDYRDEDGRHRPEVMPTLRVRRSPDAAVDPAKERVARDLCEKRAAQASLTDLRAQTEPERLTLGQAFRLFHEPRRRALPPSPQARKHHTDSRAFWEAELGPDTPWAGLRPADVRAALIRLKETGKVQTAAKRLQNLGRIARWLVEDMGYDELRDPTRGVKSSQLLEGYEPKRRRYTPEQIRRLREALTEGDPRFRLFLSILMDSGTRSVQARTLMRSAVNATLEPPPPAGWGPHGWIVLPGVKSQPPLPWPMTSRVRARVDEALAGYLAEWEAEWQDAGEDYPLIPGRYSGEHGHLVKVPATYNGLLLHLRALEERAEVPYQRSRAFHGIRRAWADLMTEEEGLDTAQRAGGWTRRETVEEHYLSRERYVYLDRARKRMEGADDE